MVNARGYLFIFLNLVRVLSIVSLLLLFASGIVSMVEDVKAVNAFIAAGKAQPSIIPDNSTSTAQLDEDYIEHSTVPNQPAGAFWAVLNWLLIIFQCIALVLSELSLPLTDRFFTTYFPVLSPSFGLGALGVIQCLLGAAVLSHRVNEFTLVSAFLLFSVGCLNVVLGLVFREKAKARRSVLVWREGQKDVLSGVETGRARGVGIGNIGGPVPFAAPPNLFEGGGATAYGYGYGNEKGVLDASRSGSLSSQKSGLGFGRQAAKFAANQGYVVREPEEAVPPYAPKPTVTFKSGSRSSHVSVSSTLSYEEAQHSVHGGEGKDEDASGVITRTNSSATAVEHH